MSREYQGNEFTYISENNNYQNVSIVWDFPLSSNLSLVVVQDLEIPGTLLILIHTQNEEKKMEPEHNYMNLRK